MKVVLAQINTRPSAVEANADRFIELAQQAQDKGAELIIFPPFALAGLDVSSVAERSDFQIELLLCLDKLKSRLPIAALVPFPKLFSDGTVVSNMPGASTSTEYALFNKGRIKILRNLLKLDGTLRFELGDTEFCILSSENPCDPLSDKLSEARLSSGSYGIENTIGDFSENSEPEDPRLVPPSSLAELSRHFVVETGAPDAYIYISHHSFDMFSDASCLAGALIPESVRDFTQEHKAALFAISSVGTYGNKIYCGGSFACSKEGIITDCAPVFEEALVFVELRGKDASSAPKQSLKDSGQIEPADSKEKSSFPQDEVLAPESSESEAFKPQVFEPEALTHGGFVPEASELESLAPEPSESKLVRAQSDALDEQHFDSSLFCWDALALALKDRVEKSGKRGVMLVLDGNLSSSALAVLAVDALGPARVQALLLKGYSEQSDKDLHALVEGLHIKSYEQNLEQYVCGHETLFKSGIHVLAAQKYLLNMADYRTLELAEEKKLLALSSADKTGLALAFDKPAFASALFAPFANVFRTELRSLLWNRCTKRSFVVPELIFGRLKVPRFPGFTRIVDDLKLLSVLDILLYLALDQGRSPQQTKEFLGAIQKKYQSEKKAQRPPRPSNPNASLDEHHGARQAGSGKKRFSQPTTSLPFAAMTDEEQSYGALKSYCELIDELSIATVYDQVDKSFSEKLYLPESVSVSRVSLAKLLRYPGFSWKNSEHTTEQQRRAYDLFKELFSPAATFADEISSFENLGFDIESVAEIKPPAFGAELPLVSTAKLDLAPQQNNNRPPSGNPLQFLSAYHPQDKETKDRFRSIIGILNDMAHSEADKQQDQDDPGFPEYFSLN